MEKLHRCEVALDETFELEIGRLAVQKDNLDVDVLAVLVQEVFEKVAHTLVCDVSAHDNVSVFVC